jgi:hypothetical protein
MLNIGAAEFLLMILALSIGAVVVLLAVRGSSDGRVGAWGRSFGVHVREEDRPLVEGVLARERRFRFGFAVLAVLGQGAVRTWFDDPLPWANTIVFAIVGYLLGAIVAEIASPSRRTPGAGAVLAPRRITDYLPRLAPIALVGLPIAAAGVVAWTIELAPGPRYRDASPRTLLLLVVASVVMSLVVLLALRMIVRRRQPTSSRELALLDDALRSSSMHAMAGGAVALQLLLLAFALGELQGALTATGGSTRVGLAAAVGALLSLAFALGAWTVLGHPSGWQPRRPLGAPAA